MTLKSSLLSLVLFFLLFSFSTAQAAQPFDVVINEIAWMGTTVSANDEWIELYNNTDSPINLSGWILKAADGSPKINLTGTILANGFYLLERTDDNALPEILADQIYTGSLGNNGENLELYDNLGRLIDAVNCNSGWFAGDNKTKQTMEKKDSKISGSDSTNWQTSQDPGGTPKAKNGEQRTINNEPEIVKLTENGSALNIIGEKEYSSGVVINEILPSPIGPDEKEEWIELFNQNNFEVDLAGWKIEDVSGKIATYTFPGETKISPQGFLVLPRTKTKITLNNDGDGVSLTSPAGNIIDKVNYEKAPTGESYNRVNSDWLWGANLTPGATNKTPSLETKSESLESKPSNGVKEKEGLAAVGEQVLKPSKFLMVLLIALAIAIFSGIIILVLKKTTTRPPHPPKQSLGPY